MFWYTEHIYKCSVHALKVLISTRIWRILTPIGIKHIRPLITKWLYGGLVNGSPASFRLGRCRVWGGDVLFFAPPAFLSKVNTPPPLGGEWYYKIVRKSKFTVLVEKGGLAVLEIKDAAA